MLNREQKNLLAMMISILVINAVLYSDLPPETKTLICLPGLLFIVGIAIFLAVGRFPK